jgi:hypothetical protein
MSSNIFDEGELMAARARHLEAVIREIKVFSRRAPLPEDRMALAELERELRTIESRWRKAGLVNETELVEA